VNGGKCVERPEDFLAGGNLELTASDRSELVVRQDAPKFGGGLSGAANTGDEKIIELGIKCTVKREAMCHCCRS